MKKRHRLLIASLVLLIAGWLGIGFGYGSKGLGLYIPSILFYGGFLAMLAGVILFIFPVRSRD